MNPVLVDTSVWVDHFRRGNPQLAQLLQQDMVLMHPMVLGELACGTPPARARTLADLQRLRPARQASMREVLGLIEREQLFGLGCGLGPVHTNVGSRSCLPARQSRRATPCVCPHAQGVQRGVAGWQAASLRVARLRGRLRRWTRVQGTCLAAHVRHAYGPATGQRDPRISVNRP
jgi:hypothetical protein